MSAKLDQLRQHRREMEYALAHGIALLAARRILADQRKRAAWAVLHPQSISMPRRGWQSDTPREETWMMRD